MEARELPAPDDLLRPRDRERTVFVVAQTWHCMYCEPGGPHGARTTVDWMGRNTDGPSGRCRDCGQKYQLAATTNPRFVPPPSEQGWR